MTWMLVAGGWVVLAVVTLEALWMRYRRRIARWLFGLAVQPEPRLRERGRE